MTAALPPGCRGRVPGGGYFVWADLPPGPPDDHHSDAAPILPAAEVVGVYFVPGARFYPKGGGQNQLRPAFYRDRRLLLPRRAHQRPRKPLFALLCDTRTARQYERLESYVKLAHGCRCLVFAWLARQFPCYSTGSPTDILCICS